MKLVLLSHILAISMRTLANAAKICDVVDQGTTFNPSEDECDIYVIDPSFFSMLSDLVNGTVEIKLRYEKENPFFHEGPVLFDDALYFTTDRLGQNATITPSWGETSQPLLDQFVSIMKLELETNNLTVVNPTPNVYMANGMTKTADGENILVLSQGFNTTGGGVYELNRKTLQLEPILTSFFGREFNSPNDIEITSDGILFFSDPVYGFEQGFRSNENPMLGSNIYRYDTSTKILTLVSTDLMRPNGVALFDDRNKGNGCTLFLSDTGFQTVSFGKNDTQSPRGHAGFGDSTLYTMSDKGTSCFSAKDGPWPIQPLTPATKGIQDGMEVHQSAELLLYCDGDGLWVWSIALHQQIGLVKLEHGCTQVMFSQKIGENAVYILSNTELYEIPLNFRLPTDTSSANQKHLHFLSALVVSTLFIAHLLLL